MSDENKAVSQPTSDNVQYVNSQKQANERVNAEFDAMIALMRGEYRSLDILDDQTQDILEHERQLWYALLRDIAAAQPPNPSTTPKHTPIRP